MTGVQTCALPIFLSPISTTCSSSCFLVFSTTSSIRAGCILPSLTNRCNESRAISLLSGSKEDKMMASGVSSTTKSTPVAASMARMFLPSLPMICPLISPYSNCLFSSSSLNTLNHNFSCFPVTIKGRRDWSNA